EGWGPEAKLGSPRQKPNAACCTRHDQNRPCQRGFAAYSVTHMAPNKPSDGTNQKGDGEQRKGPYESFGYAVRAEGDGCDNYSKVAVGAVVEPLGEVSNKTRDNDLAPLFRTNPAGMGSFLAREGRPEVLT